MNNNKLNGDHLFVMNRELAMRGPDGEGYLLTNNDEFLNAVHGRSGNAKVVSFQNGQQIGLGHCRLSITDLNDNAAQPMTEATGRYWIVFNGQIYNHAELRKELEALGYRFVTSHSDTEVILNAYSCWGAACLEKFNGMWAFCIWDSKDNVVFMSRDRIGKQPLFYTVSGHTLYFASELNALSATKKISSDLNEFSVYNYLTYANVPSPDTIYKHVFKVPAAHYLLFRPGEELVPKRYWNPAGITHELRLSESEIIHQIKEKLYASTELRMSADVNVGMLLSGGLDSSINLACMSRYSRGPVKAYTVGFENKNGYQNELQYARKVSEMFGARLQEVIVTEKDFFDFLPDMSRYLDEPIADTANTPIYFVARAAHNDQVKVLLSGEGGDELFIGYEHWRLIYEFEKYFSNKPRLASAFEFIHKHSGFKNKRPHYQDYSYKIRNNWPVFWGGTEVRTERDKHKILSPDFMAEIGSYNSFEPKAALYEMVKQGGYDTFRWMTVNDLQNRLPDQLLARLDRMMMATSVEGRNPFLDVNLIEFMLSVPPDLKVKQKTEKYLLKKAFEGILPNEILHRRKDSFTVPLKELFGHVKRKNEYMEVIRKFNAATGIFKPGYLNELELPGKLHEFWNILNLALWHEKHS